KLDDKEGAGWEARQQTQAIFAEDLGRAADLSYLDGLLKYPDLRIRQRAQFELVERGKEGAEILKKNIQQTDHQLARIHGIIGLSQLARLENISYADPIVPLLQDKDLEIRAQAAKWLGDIRYQAAGDGLLPVIIDANDRVNLFAAQALGRSAYQPV